MLGQNTERVDTIEVQRTNIPGPEQRFISIQLEVRPDFKAVQTSQDYIFLKTILQNNLRIHSQSTSGKKSKIRLKVCCSSTLYELCFGRRERS